MASQQDPGTDGTGTLIGTLIGDGRMSLRILLLVLIVVPCLIAHGLWGLVRIASPWPRVFLGLTARVVGIVVTPAGGRVRRDVFYVANHVGWIDIPILAGATGCAFVAQDLIASWPVIGWLARRNHTVFVSRTDRLGVSGQIETLRAALAEHTPVTIFPEGTTTDGRSLLPFKPSLFAVMVPPPKPMQVQPVALHFDDLGVDLAWVCEETALQNARRIFRNGRRLRVGVEFLAPFDPADFPDRKAIAAQANAQIAAALQTRTGLPLGPYQRFLPPYSPATAQPVEDS
jgi:1-acyl-sn-glycerol-3-phosphate acyltransferase